MFAGGLLAGDLVADAVADNRRGTQFRPVRHG
jgi:hypothetical protein